MAKTLDDAIEAVLYLASQLDELREAANPKERFNIDPFAVAFPESGEWIKESSGSSKGLHVITLEIHKARKDLPRDLDKIIPFGERVKNLFLSDTNQTLPDKFGVATVDTITSFNYDFGPLGWADIDTLGWAFQIGVKIRGTV